MNYTSADGFLHSENAFSGVRQVILDEMLKGGSIQTRFGGSIIDMRRTDIPVGETPLDVDCKFGGIELYVPADWTIKCFAAHSWAVMRINVGRERKILKRCW